MQKVPISVKIIYYLTVAVHHLCLFACSLAVIMSLLILTGLLKDDMQLHVEMPVKVNVIDKGSGMFNGQAVDIHFVEGSGKIHFVDTPWGLARILVIPLIVIFPFIYWLVRQFYMFMKNVRFGKVFDESNYLRLRRIAYGILGIWLIMVVYMQIMYYAMVTKFQFEHIEITKDERWFEGILVVGLLMLVLAHVFSKGQEIEVENQLTI